MFHVSLLRSALPEDTEVVTALPEPPAPHSSPDFPEEVLARRMVTRGASKIPQVLIKWPSQPKELASWEDFFELQSRFPRAAAWGQAATEAEGDVTPVEPNVSPHGAQQNESRPKRRMKPNKWFDPASWEL